jgi:para-aminobenzoate synthetase/4-amino-4-deoxychorismate lyase
MTIPAISETALQSLLEVLADVESYVFLESTRVTDENHQSLLFLNPQEHLICKPGDDPTAFFKQAQDRLDMGCYLAGYLSYEFGYLLEPALQSCLKNRPLSSFSKGKMNLADLGVYQIPHIFDHQTSSFTGAGPWPTGDIKGSQESYKIDNLRLSQDKKDYLQALDRIKSYIAAGDTYQVNYTLKLLFDYHGSIADLYFTLRRNQSVSYGGIIKSHNNSILTFSPELFFRKVDGTITVRPMKGTMHRGRNVAEDREYANFLHNDIKNRSENVMIVDLLRNDLGRLSRMDGVKVQSLFDVETYETLHQMTSSIRGEVGNNISLEEMFKALFPCGSVTGAPKIRTMEIIRELEVSDRGVYTGAIGYISPAGDAVFNVPIRTVLLQGTEGEMGIGSGIVWDSDPEKEWQECKLKGYFLTKSAPDFKLIETMFWHPDRGYWQLDLHLKRLIGSAEYFAYPLDLEKISGALTALAENFKGVTPQQCQRVRLTVDRNGDLEITHADFPHGIGMDIDLDEVLLQSVTDSSLPEVVFSDSQTDSRSPFLCHKTTLRQLYDDERKRLTEAGYYEVLFINELGEVTEGTVNNIFIKKGRNLVTPPLSSGLLPGVLREYLMSRYPDRIIEAPISKKELEQAEAVFVGNSVRGLTQVKVVTSG